MEVSWTFRGRMDLRDEVSGTDSTIWLDHWMRKGYEMCTGIGQGGYVDDRCEIYGKKGHTRADLLRGSSLLTYSEEGYGYAVEKAGQTKGYTFTMFEEIWNYGFPQEMQPFVNCVLGKETHLETGEDGREVLRIMYAAYQPAGEGCKIEFPYDPPRVSKPIDLWKGVNGS